MVRIQAGPSHGTALRAGLTPVVPAVAGASEAATAVPAPPLNGPYFGLRNFGLRQWLRLLKRCSCQYFVSDASQ
jgi:hypothetical protein